jgi:hypothetical protein
MKPTPRPDLTVTPTGKLLTEAIIDMLRQRKAEYDAAQAAKKAA